MALDLSVPKEFHSGTHVSCTVVSEAGEPSAEVTVDGQKLDASVTWLSEAKYKVFFTLPDDLSGKEGEVSVKKGDETASESFTLA